MLSRVNRGQAIWEQHKDELFKAESIQKCVSVDFLLDIACQELTDHAWDMTGHTMMTSGSWSFHHLLTVIKMSSGKDTFIFYMNEVLLMSVPEMMFSIWRPIL